MASPGSSRRLTLFPIKLGSSHTRGAIPVQIWLAHSMGLAFKKNSSPTPFICLPQGCHPEWRLVKREGSFAKENRHQRGQPAA